MYIEMVHQFNIIILLNLKLQKGEAQIRFVQKGDPGGTGVVRLGNNPSKVVQRTTIKSTPQGIVRQTTTLPNRQNIANKGTPVRNQQVRQIISQPAKSTIGQTTLAQVSRVYISMGVVVSIYVTRLSANSACSGSKTNF